MADTTDDKDELSEEEAAKRRDEALKRALATPPKPHGPANYSGKKPKKDHGH